LFAENQLRIVFEQRLDLVNIATLDCVMNGTSEGNSDPSHRDDSSSETTENRPADEPAEERSGLNDSVDGSLLVYLRRDINPEKPT
jgi:hypothetical protein